MKPFFKTETRQDRIDIIETLKHLPNAIELEIAGLPESALRFRPTENAWSIKEVIGHLRDNVVFWQKRFSMVWSLTDPLLPTYDGEARVKDGNYQEADVRQFIAEIRQHRNESVDILAHAVDWTRLGQLPGTGRRSLRQLAENAANHERGHIDQIRQLKAAQSLVGAAR
jgi:hypothetical protein